MGNRGLVSLQLILFALTIVTGWSVTTTTAYSQSYSGTVAKSARLVGDGLRTRFVVDLSRSVPFNLFTLQDPYRIVVDLPNVSFQMPPDIGNKGRGLVSAFRYGLFAKGKSRIVIDVTGPVKIDKSFVLKRGSGQPARFVLDLIPTDRTTFIQELQKQKQRQAQKSKTKLPVKLATLPPIPKPKSSPRTKRKPLVFIDPGHGGIDPGAVGSLGTREKTVVLQFSRLLKKELEKSGQLRVRMTRNTDVFVPLKSRTALARRQKADLFLSIHADSAPKGYRKARGATVYTLSEKASDLEARQLAQRENRSDIIAGVQLPTKSQDIADILIDLVQRETKNYSVSFANLLVGRLKNEIVLRKDPVRFANFQVLKAPDVPSLLVELGYLSTPQEEKLIRSRDWQRKVARSVARAIETYFKRHGIRNPY